MNPPEGMLELPAARQQMRGFQVYTREGSCFIARFDPRYEDLDVDEIYGWLTLIGRPRGSEQELQLEGIGAVPQPGGRVATSAVPSRVYLMNGETIKEFPSETILRVVEFQIPTPR